VKLSLSTNWCSRTVAAGEAIAEKAAGLGFDELELGYAATDAQVAGIRRRLDLIRVGSVHAFCPVPISAPDGHPELYRLADFDRESRDFAKFHVMRSVELAAGIGADTVVLHAGKVGFGGLFDRLDSQKLKALLGKAGVGRLSSAHMKALSLAMRRRRRRGLGMLQCFRPVLASLVPELEKRKVTLALENMPYLEGFPDESEMTAILDEFAGAPVKAWFDTGHHLVRVNRGWVRGFLPFPPEAIAGMHLNDVESVNDDHLAPGEGKVDFAALKNAAREIPHLVFEPSPGVGEESLKRALGFIRELWK
jgi:sugar phosphate isomerase/epimerase